MEPPPQPGLLALGNWKMLPGLLEMHLAWQGWRWGKAPPLTENKLCFPVCEEKKKKEIIRGFVLEEHQSLILAEGCA